MTLLTALSRNGSLFMTANDLIQMWGILETIETDCLALGFSLSSY